MLFCTHPPLTDSFYGLLLGRCSVLMDGWGGGEPHVVKRDQCSPGVGAFLL